MKIVTALYNLSKGTRGNETAILHSHKLKFWLFGLRVYQVKMKTKTAYFITDKPLPSFKYKAFHISDGIRRLTDYWFIWRQK